MGEKIIRDPVHDVIAFQMDRPIDALLFRLLNAAEFQRLRRIRQLGLTNLAYPGADHSRYSHCLGVMETARKMLAQLEHAFPIDEEQKTVCLVAALLHDIGHGPFSHLFERVSGIEHEQLTCRVIEDPDSQVHQLLIEHDPQLPSKVVRLLLHQPHSTWLGDILSSQLDADRFDYLLRDNLMTGSQYGDYDLSWLVHALTIDEAGNRLAVTIKGVSAVEAYLQSRYHMYRNVYFHKVVRSGEGMVKLALQRAKRLAVQDRLEWPQREDAVYRALLGQQLTIAQFTELDDISMLHCFKLWMGTTDAVLAGLCRGILYRRLYKTIHLPTDDPQQAKQILTAAEQAVAAAGGDPCYDLFYDEPADTPYETYQPEQDRLGSEIMVRDTNNKVVPLATLSPMSQALNRQLMFRRLHVAEPWAPTVRAVLDRL